MYLQNAGCVLWVFLGDCDWASLNLCLSFEGVHNDQQETNEEDQEDR